MELAPAESSNVEDVLLAYRDLVGREARLAEAAGSRGLPRGASVGDQWPLIHDLLKLYARGLSSAGALVLTGAPDAGSRFTGIPFHGPREARERLGLEAEGDATSPSGSAFWTAVRDIRPEALFSVVHLAHANPFGMGSSAVAKAAADAHVKKLLGILRPQAVVAVGAPALEALGRVLGERDVVALSKAPEASWLARWPVGTGILRYPYAEAGNRSPFRMRIVPLPALDGALGAEAGRALRGLLASFVP